VLLWSRRPWSVLFAVRDHVLERLVDTRLPSGPLGGALHILLQNSDADGLSPDYAFGEEHWQRQEDGAEVRRTARGRRALFQSHESHARG
jgi:hypothetical protein